MTDGVTYEGLSPAQCAASMGLPNVVLLAETASTLDVAHQLAEQGAQAGTLVVADTQTAGRGRMGRSWRSGKGEGVWCTVIERVEDVRALDVLSIRVGLAIADALDELAGEGVRLKWPNDLLLDSGKVGGILCETRWAGERAAWVAIGVGINVVAPAGVTGAAGLPKGTQRVQVLERVVRGVRAAAAWGGHLDADELASYARRDALAGRRIASPAAGVVAGIDTTGALVVNTADTGRSAHRSGTVVLQEHA